jgi:alkylation response protein AidB-like acyl-CoA dehydrogenase
VPLEEYGGSGGGVLALAILSEELAHSSGGLAITPLVSSYMAGPHLARYGTEEQKEHWLRPLLAGECVAAIAVTEPSAGSDVAGLASTATAVDSGFRLRGTKMFITNAGLAGVIIVAAKTNDEAGHRGITTFLVERDAEGMTLSPPLKKLGWHAFDTREIVFDDCTVAAGSVLGASGRGFHQIMEAFQVERISLAAMAVGLAQTALDDAVAPATAVFSKRGYRAALMNDIATKMGIGKASLYHYVASKEDVLIELYEDVRRENVIFFEEEAELPARQQSRLISVRHEYEQTLLEMVARGEAAGEFTLTTTPSSSSTPSSAPPTGSTSGPSPRAP